MAISLKRNKPIQNSSVLLPEELQRQVKSSGTISAVKPQGFIQRIRTAVNNFFGGDINTRIQRTYNELNSKGIDDNTATKMAIELVKNKGFITNSIKEDYKRLSDEQKKLVLQSGTNIASKQAQEMVVSSLTPGKGILGGGKQINKKIIEKTVPQIVKEIDDPIQRVLTALKEAKPIRAQQQAIYTAERAAKLRTGVEAAEKIGGQAGFLAKKAALKGELTKLKFEPLKIFQNDLDDIFNKIQNSSNLTEWEKFPAAQGFQKMWQGQLPTEGEIKILSRVLPQELITELGKKQGINLLSETESILNLPRAVMTSLDLSFGGRQGAFLGTRYRQEFVKNWVKQFEEFGSENAYKASQEAMRTNKYFGLAQKSGLSFTDIASGLDKSEEAFMSKWVDKLPGIRQSARAYTGFANKFRMDVFSRLAGNAEKLGLNLETVGKNGKSIAEDIAKFVNVGTGRGGLGPFEAISKELNAVFFSPRLMSSRLTLMNPLFYTKLNPYVRKEALKTLLTFGSTWTTILGIASTIPGVQVGTNVKNADFGKIKVGNTRIDIGAGFQQYLRAAGQLITGKYVSTTTGKEYTLGEGYKPMTRFDILLRQAETKSSPIASFIIDILQGQDAVGNKFDITQAVKDRFIPMVIGDTLELAQDNPDLLPIEVLGLLGIGVQTYQPQKKTTTKKSSGSGNTSLKRN